MAIVKRIEQSQGAFRLRHPTAPRQTFASCRALTVAAASRFNSARNIPSTAGPFSVRRAQVAAQNADHQALDGSTLDSAQR